MNALDPGSSVVDVGDADFEREVLERSRELPVVVDLWAPWCGPCRTLGPILERVVAEQRGAVRLAKVDVDQAPAVAQALGARSIPLVVAIKNGSVVAEFVGAQPEAAVRRFVEALLPSEADRLAAEGRELGAAGHLNAAEERFRAALAADPRHGAALVGLAGVLGERDAVEEALALLEQLTLATPELEQEAERLAAELRTRAGGAAEPAELDALRARVAAAPDDLAARLELGRALAAARRFEDALAILLEVVERDRAFAEEGARKAMLDVFGLLGGEHPLTQEFRSRLAGALFR